MVRDFKTVQISRDLQAIGLLILDMINGIAGFNSHMSHEDRVSQVLESKSYEIHDDSWIDQDSSLLLDFLEYLLRQNTIQPFNGNLKEVSHVILGLALLTLYSIHFLAGKVENYGHMWKMHLYAAIHGLHIVERRCRKSTSLFAAEISGYGDYD